MHFHGFSGKGYNTSEIGKTMKKLGYLQRKTHGRSKYLVKILDYDAIKAENDMDAVEMIEEQQKTIEDMPF